MIRPKYSLTFGNSSIVVVTSGPVSCIDRKTVIAKGMSNGYPMGAVVGSREAMEEGRIMFVSSSYWSDNVGLAASLVGAVLAWLGIVPLARRGLAARNGSRRHAVS